MIKTSFGLERQKIQAVLDKKALAQAVALVVKTLLISTKSEKDDFWITIDLDVHIQERKALDKHARINVYDRLDAVDCEESPGANTPLHSEQRKIKVEFDQESLGLAMAWLVKTLVTAVQTGIDEFWVKIDSYVHIHQGKALEKKARINVYGDLLDSYGTTIVDSVDSNEIPSEVFRSFCENFNKASVGDL